MLNIDASSIISFACSESASFMITGSNKSAWASIGDRGVPSFGLTYFYKKPRTQFSPSKWEVVENATEEQLESLPDLCFATRYPIA